jgi:hypothetical protein
MRATAAAAACAPECDLVILAELHLCVLSQRLQPACNGGAAAVNTCTKQWIAPLQTHE